MPQLEVPGTTLYYEDSGGPGPAVVFSHGLLWSHRMFAAQVAHLAPRRRCIGYDHRGQGQSAPATEASVSIETCAEDAAALIERLGVGPCDFVGLSMGGFVGMRLAARRPELIRRLVLLETSADAEPPENVPRYRRLALVARTLGLRPVATPVMRIMFGRTIREDPRRRGQLAHWRQELLRNRRDIVRAVYGVIERAPVYDELPNIRAPTLVVVGEDDTATVPAKAERIAARIPGARLVRVPGAGHSSCIEEPARINTLLEEFLLST